MSFQRASAPVDPAGIALVLDPEGSGCMLPWEAYCTEDVLAWERTNLFARAWVCAGRATGLAEVGSRLAVSVGDAAVLVVRADDGTLRGYANVCRHRGHELAPCGSSSTGRSIVCPYHGWRYSLDGSLLSTPRFVRPAGFDPDELGLVQVPVADWWGWIMVNPSGTAGPVDAFYAGMGERLAAYEPARLVVGASHHYELAANWKLAVENYQECYHCPRIHPELCAVSPPESGENYEGHGGMWVGGWQSLQDHAATMSLSGESPTGPLRGLDPAATRIIDYLGVLPNLLVSLHPDYVMTHRIEPLSPDRTAIECQWLFDPEVAAEPGFDPSFAVEFWDVTNRQDWAACEGVQRGLRSGGYRPGPFSAEEDGVAQFVRVIARAYRDGGFPPAG